MSTPTLTAMFFHDLIERLHQAHPHGYTRQAVQSLGPWALLIDVMNWRARLIAPRPRTVHISEAMRLQPGMKAHSQALRRIYRDLETGADLTPYLSKGADSIVLPPTPGRTGRKTRLDAMLSDWGVYHFHLGPLTTGPSKHVGRTKDLMFLLIGPDDARLIGIFEHGQWAAEQVLRVIVTEWLEHSKFHELPEGVVPEVKVDPASWLKLRASGINLVLSLDGRYFMSGDMTLAHGSLAITDTANEIRFLLEKADADIARMPGLFHPKVKFGWYGTDSVFGFNPVVPLPWWFDGKHWAPRP
ncbi:hypothetical protein [Kocuria carniphila]|uniref:hypothetical protein n=1 Tax=Kocuria carniphila TaxID=262208 RepID=UPI0034CFD33F